MTLSEAQRALLEFRMARGEPRITQEDLAAHFGYQRSTISHWFSEGKFPWLALEYVAERRGVTVETLLNIPAAADERATQEEVARTMGGQRRSDQAGSQLLNDATLFSVPTPLYARANAGEGGGLALEGEQVAIPGALLANRDVRLVLVRGDCMDDGRGNSIRNGDVVVLDHQEAPRDGWPVCVRIKSTDEIVFKLWHPLPDGEHVELIPRVEIEGIGRRVEVALEDIEYVGSWVYTIRPPSGASLILANPPVLMRAPRTVGVQRPNPPPAASANPAVG